jgi:hypothetical protein
MQKHRSTSTKLTLPLPAIKRIPKEIWWDIFDDLIDVPLYFATKYRGDNWSKDAQRFMPLRVFQLYESIQPQRKIIGSVCRAWQLWAQAKKDHYFILRDNSRSLKLDLERAQRAHRALLSLNDMHTIDSAFRDGVNWEILCAEQWKVAEFPPIQSPRLRRLFLTSAEARSFDPIILMLALGRFINITWLDYEVSSPYDTPVSIEKSTQPITLPNLQVLYYTSLSFFQFPFSHVLLPSLQYLAVHCCIPAGNVPMKDLLLAYRQTIKSVIIQAHRVPQDTQIVYFPPWSSFPRLEELVLGQQWSIHFKPLPQGHPLRKFVARHASFSALASALDAINMRQLVLLRAEWDNAGRLELGEDSPTNAEDASLLVEKAKRRGIRFVVAWTDEDSSPMTREEALALVSKSRRRSKPSKPGLFGRLFHLR